MSYSPDGMPKPKLRLRDWLFGAGGKRRLLEALLAEEGRTWTEAELGRAAHLHAKGSVDVHVKALVQLGVLRKEGRHYMLVGGHPLVAPLRMLLAVMGTFDDAELERPPN
jgi:hypothetical protein